MKIAFFSLVPTFYCDRPKTDLGDTVIVENDDIKKYADAEFKPYSEVWETRIEDGFYYQIVEWTTREIIEVGYYSHYGEEGWLKD